MTPRPFDKVIEAVLNVIPKDYEGRHGIEGSFKYLRNNAAYTLPEEMHRIWGMAAGALGAGMKLAHEQNLEWAETVKKIFNAEVDFNEYLT